MSATRPQSAKPERSASGYDLRPLSPAERERYAQSLNAEERRVLLNQGTEPPFCGLLLKNKEAGIYACKLCGLPLFSSEHKFESGTGWPSFYQAIDPDHITELPDYSHGMIRVEIRCARCDGHLGHVFDDGPPPTYKRYCLNSVSMEFFPKGQEPKQRVAATG
jgi:peptide-methionine (R)-S-oxide reductase